MRSTLLIAVVVTLNIIALAGALYTYLLIAMGYVAGSPRIALYMHIHSDDSTLVLDKPTLSLSIRESDTRIERYAYEFRIVVYLIKNGRHTVLDKTLSYSTATQLEVDNSRTIRLLNLSTLNTTLCGEHCNVVIELYVTKLGIDLGLGKSITWLFSFWPWKACSITIPITEASHGYSADLRKAQVYTYGTESETYVDTNEVSCLVEAYPSKQFATYMVNSINYIPNSVLRRVEQTVRILLPLIIAVLALDILIAIRSLTRQTHT